MTTSSNIPPALAKRLEPGEPVIWLSASRPRHVNGSVVASLIGLAMSFLMVGMFWESLTSGYARMENILLLVLLPVVFVAIGIRSWYASGSDIFALTDRRFLIIESIFPQSVQRYARDFRVAFMGGTVWNITRLRATGTAATGNITLRHLSRGGPRRSFGPVDRPVEVAAQIGRTLGLAIPLDNQTR